MSRCRSCDAQIRWATTSAGKAMPLDFEPSEFGNVALAGIERPVATVLAGVDLTTARATGRRLFMPHHATCPQGREWHREQTLW